MGRGGARTWDLGDGHRAEVGRIEAHDWDRELDSFDDATIYQTSAYGSVRWGESRLRRVVVKARGEVVSMAQVALKRVPLLGAGVAYVPWGPLYRRKGGGDFHLNFQYGLRALRTFCLDERGLVLRIAPNVAEEGDRRCAAILEGEGYEWADHAYRTILLDLSPPLETIRKRLDPKWRNKLNQAERNNLSVTEGGEASLYDTFLLLMKEMRSRKGFVPGVDYEELGRVQECLPGPKKMRTFLCLCNGKAVAAVVVSALGDKGIYLLGATGNEGLDLRGSYLLQWRAVQWLKEVGCRWYDLGGVDPEGNPGVFQFKKGMGGLETRSIGRFEASKGRLIRASLRLADYLRKQIRRK